MNGGVTPLYEAVRKNHLDVVKILVRAGARLNVRESGNMWTPLHMAARNGNVAITRYLLGAGAEPDPKNNEGNTPLILAAQKGYPDVVETLLIAGADINQTNQKRQTALFVAVMKGQSSTVDVLLKYHPDVSIRGKYSFNYYTPYELALKRGFDDIVRLFEAQGYHP